jgi:hypothetical protein
MPEVQDEVVSEDELLGEEEVIEEGEEVVAEEEKKRVRRILSDNNEYVFDSFDGAANGKGNLKYEDGSSVENYRVIAVTKGDYDADKKACEGGEKVDFVVAGSPMQAAVLFLESKGYSVELANKKKQRGRVSTKIEPTLLMFGKMLVRAAKGYNGDDNINPDVVGWKDGTAQSDIDSWNTLYARGTATPTKYAHYRAGS